MSHDEPDFPAYVSAKDDDKGRLKTIHVSSELEQSKAWRAEQERLQAERSEESNSTAEDEGQPNILTPDANGKPPSITDGFHTHLVDFVKAIRSFHDLIAIDASVRAIFPNMFIDRELNPFRENLVLIDDDETTKLYGVPAAQVSALNRKMKRLDHIEDGVSVIPASVILSLVARYDAQISSLVRFLLSFRKERLASEGRMIAVSEVLAAKSFDELISELLDDEIHSLMRGSHADQIKYIEDNFSISISAGFERWPQFLEIFERRNLAAHGEGFVNARYDRICKQAKVPNDERLEIGAKLDLSDRYLRSSTDLILEFGVLLVWWLWLKHSEKDAELAYNAINTVTYDLILEKRYRLSSRILESVLSRKTPNAPEVFRRMMAVNLANCHKKMNNEKKFADALSMFDWTASADEFKISVASLKGDIDKVCSLMARVTAEDVVGKVGLRDWPVFDWVREEPKFKEQFQSVFGESIEVADERVTKTKADGVLVEAEEAQL